MLTQTLMATDRSTPVFYQPSVQINANLYNTFGITDFGKNNIGYVTRSQALGEVDFGIASIRINNLEIHSGFLASYATKSISYNDRQLLSFTALGFTIGTNYHFSRKFALSSLFSMRFPFYKDTDIKSAAIGITIIPEYVIIPGLINDYSITLPVRIDYRKDFISYGIGIGFKWTYNKLIKAPVWLITQQELENQKKYYIH